MIKKYKKSLFIFRRDLRLSDNTALLASLNSSKLVIPCFIFDERQIKDNPYRCDNLLQFMIESLEDLKSQLKDNNGRLYLFYGIAEEIVNKLITSEQIQAVYINRDYTPFSLKRDAAIKSVCEQSSIDFHVLGDYLLNEPGDIRKDDGGVYTIYSPFMRKSILKEVRKSVSNNLNNYYQGSVKIEEKDVFKKVLNHINLSLAVRGGRSNALKILKDLKKFTDYDVDRNFPAKKATTYLSAHNKFGTFSIREVYHAIYNTFGPDHTLIKELYWRDFFTHIGFHFPHVLGNSFHRQLDKIKWENDTKKFKAWCEGKTGFPIVDAGMRELNTTGFMHNRVRMITASFLVKDLHIDWRWGEKYFAQKLVDYDPLVNNGNWQWAASTGCDAQPYFRIFNPWLQQEKFDSNAEYIKKWIPELKNVSTGQIHSLFKHNSLFSSDYPVCIVDHQIQSKRALAMYKTIKK